MGYEMGLSIYKVDKDNVPTEEVALLSFWCSAGRGIASFIRECIDKPLEEMTILTPSEISVMDSRLRSMYAGSDVIGEATMEYILRDCDNYDYKDEVVDKARKFGININTALMAANNFYSNSEDMSYSTFLDFKKTVNSIANMELTDDYRIVCWISE